MVGFHVEWHLKKGILASMYFYNEKKHAVIGDDL